MSEDGKNGLIGIVITAVLAALSIGFGVEGHAVTAAIFGALAVASGMMSMAAIIGRLIEHYTKPPM